MKARYLDFKFFCGVAGSLCSVANLEFFEFTGPIFPRNVQLSDVGSGWTAFAEFDDRVYLLFIAFKDCFYSPIS